MPLARSIRSLGIALTAAGLLVVGQAQAASHALILWISDYDDSAFAGITARSPDLPGARVDGASARRIAAVLGVPPSNIVEFSDGQLSLVGMQRALEAFAHRVQPGDKAFVYYAGHGTQSSASQGCHEGLLTYDNKVLSQSQFDAALQQIASRASQLVVMNDSCFSGGAASARLGTRSAAKGQLRARAYPYPGDFRPESADAPGYRCGVPINSARTARSAGHQFLYVASAASTEVAWESGSGGGLGTNAWLQCLTAATSDRDRSGRITGQELRDCAQQVMDPAFLDDPLSRQRVTLQGNERLPVVFTADVAASGDSTVQPANALQDLKEASDPNIVVGLTLSGSRLRIGVDLLDFGVTSSRSGYLYLLHVKPDGKSFQILFPNGLDTENRIDAGRQYRFPRPHWRIRSQGPEGTGHLMAIVSDRPRDFSRHAPGSGPFATLPGDVRAANRLAVEAGVGYGASAVIPIQELR